MHIAIFKYLGQSKEMVFRQCEVSDEFLIDRFDKRTCHTQDSHNGTAFHLKLPDYRINYKH